jgi:type II secretory pathway pseudopilin PulG
MLRFKHKENMLNRNQKGFSAVETIIVIVIVALIGFVGWYVWSAKKKTDNSLAAASSGSNSQTSQKQSNTTTKPAKPTVLSKGDFSSATETGSLQIEGYASTDKRFDVQGDTQTCSNDCKKDDYILFNIAGTGNDDIFMYLKNNNGNSYVQDKAIGMGCLTYGQISYYNRSDANGSKKFTISASDSSKIMSATAAKPIILELNKLKLSGGGSSPTCYSQFTNFKVVN